jgi:hypothetical protein
MNCSTYVHRYTLFGYTFHLSALMCNVIAFAMVILSIFIYIIYNYNVINTFLSHIMYIALCR